MSKYAEIARFLRDELWIRTFIETGILGCETTLWAADHFDRVYGLEIEPNCVKRAKALFKDRPHVTIILGDSGVTLPELLPSILEPALIILDAHFYGSCTPKAILMELQCPIRRELQAIAKSTLPHAIIIDDIKFFRDRDLPEGTDITQFPSLDEITQYLDNKAIFLYKGTLIAVPKLESAAVRWFITDQKRMPAIRKVL